MAIASAWMALQAPFAWGAGVPLPRAADPVVSVIIQVQEEARPERERRDIGEGERRGEQASLEEMRRTTQEERRASGVAEPGSADEQQRQGSFASHYEMRRHFSEHGADFGSKSAEEYEAQADRFLNGPRSQFTLEKRRQDGDIVRYDTVTEEFGVVRGDGTLRTYFKPDPKKHGKATNLDYFNAQ